MSNIKYKNIIEKKKRWISFHLPLWFIETYINNVYTIVYNQLKKHNVNITIFSVWKYVFLASIQTPYVSFNIHFKTEVFQTRYLLKYILYNIM